MVFVFNLLNFIGYYVLSCKQESYSVSFYWALISVTYNIKSEIARNLSEYQYSVFLRYTTPLLTITIHLLRKKSYHHVLFFPGIQVLLCHFL